MTFDVCATRRRFSSLAGEFAFFDAPGGTQVPDEVGDAIAQAMKQASANLGAPYATGARVREILVEAERRSAAFLACGPEEIAFGANMTTLNFALSRAYARGLARGDHILVSELDHEGGVAPWRELAADLGLTLDFVGLRDDTTLDLDDLSDKLTSRTRVVAFAWASNAIGTVVDASAACALAHEAGALAWVDGVHYAAHEAIDVRAIGADVLLCSSYKWCGPHLGIAYLRGDLVRGWRPYRVTPVPTAPTARDFLTGTPSFEALAGLNATYEYLDSLGGIAGPRAHERALGERFVSGLPHGVRLYGLPGQDGRVPTFLVNVDGVEAATVAATLASRELGVWAHDTWYAQALYRQLGYDREAVRIGFFHYNTTEEVDRLLAELASLALRSGTPG